MYVFSCMCVNMHVYVCGQKCFCIGWMCVVVCMCLFISVCMCVVVLCCCVCADLYMCVCDGIYVYSRTYICMDIYVVVCKCVYVRMYVCKKYVVACALNLCMFGRVMHVACVYSSMLLFYCVSTMCMCLYVSIYVIICV